MEVFKMVSHRSFRVIGYCYAIFVIVLALVDIKEMVVYLRSGYTSHILLLISLFLNLLLLLFYSILLIGIWKNQIQLVKTFRVFFHVFFGTIMSFLGILILVLTVEMMFFDGKFSSVLVFLFWCSLASFIGFWLLTLWIIHGVIEAIQFELKPNEAALNRPDGSNKLFLSSSV